MNLDSYERFDEEPQIDLTPLIDCLFMLIIFFVLTMSFSKPVLEVVLPQAESAEKAADRSEILLSVKADGTFWLDQTQTTPEQLAKALDDRPEALLNIYMDGGAPFERFVEILDVAKKKRGGRFVISTDPKEAKKS